MQRPEGLATGTRSIGCIGHGKRQIGFQMDETVEDGLPLLNAGKQGFGKLAGRNPALGDGVRCAG
jgi:hypothetical protein